jgi:hypothetical protein
VIIESADEFQQRARSLGVGEVQGHLGQPLPSTDSE